MKKKIAFIEMESDSVLLEQWYLLLAPMSSVSFHFFVHSKANEKLTVIPSDFITVGNSVVDFLKLYLKEGVAWERNQILQAKRFGVLSPRVKYEIEKRSTFKNKLELIQMNYCNSFHFAPADVLQIMMPGDISNKRKDLDLVLS